MELVWFKIPYPVRILQKKLAKKYTLREAINKKCIFWAFVPKSWVPPPLPLFGTQIFGFRYSTFGLLPFNPKFEICSKQNFDFTSGKIIYLKDLKVI